VDRENILCNLLFVPTLSKEFSKMLKISPYQQNLLRNLHKREKALYKEKMYKTIAPSGPRAHCLDLANASKATPQFLVSLKIKVNKYYKQKNMVFKETALITKQKLNINSAIYEVSNINIYTVS
jgi:hypothetical protein